LGKKEEEKKKKSKKNSLFKKMKNKNKIQCTYLQQAAG